MVLGSLDPKWLLPRFGELHQVHNTLPQVLLLPIAEHEQTVWIAV